jgi:hypothetical protein
MVDSPHVVLVTRCTVKPSLRDACAQTRSVAFVTGAARPATSKRRWLLRVSDSLDTQSDVADPKFAFGEVELT